MGPTISHGNPNNIDDPERVAALRQTKLLDSAPTEAFDRLTRLATRTLDVPVALVSLVDEDRQFFKSCVGLPEPWGTYRQTPLSHSFCQHVVGTGGALVIEDAREHPLVHDNGAVFDLGVVAYAGFPLVTPDGQVLGSFCAIDTKPRQWSANDLDILRDLAASASSEIELEKERDEARSASRAKDRFLAVLSHELRTPLSPASLLAASLAADEMLPEQAREDARTIQRNVRLMTRLIDDLLDVTRIEHGKLSLSVETVDLHGVLRDVTAMCGQDAEAKGVCVLLDLNATRQGVRGDPVRLRQVFANLLKNAVKFTPSAGRVVLRSADATDVATVRVSVADTGIGVDAAVLPKLFDPFEQGSRAITDEFSGLGLGLAITKGLVEAHGGNVHAASEGAGRGTTFTVELPAAVVPASCPAMPKVPSAESSDGSGSRALRILLVDDHHDTLRAMSRLLRRKHRVTTANSVTAALAAASGESFDVLISDIGLPDGTGLELMRELMKQRPIRGIALTGYGMESDIRQTRDAGYLAHLTKPVDLKQLETILDGLI